jgi:acyl-CoA reductase-like NAD-dependent aldehyde dehydrogenase
VDQRPLARTQRVARQLEAGTVSVNTFDAAAGHGIPHGGWKQSGIGLEVGLDGPRAYTRSNVVTIAIG